MPCCPTCKKNMRSLAFATGAIAGAVSAYHYFKFRRPTNAMILAGFIRFWFVTYSVAFLAILPVHL